MITNFEDITAELTDQEIKLVQPIINGLKKRTKNNPIKSDEMVIAMNNYCKLKNIPVNVTGVKIRKITNYIRSNGLLPVIATSSGYYISYDLVEIGKQIVSLRQRANAINNSADGLEKYAKQFYNQLIKKQ